MIKPHYSIVLKNLTLILKFFKSYEKLSKKNFTINKGYNFFLESILCFSDHWIYVWQDVTKNIALKISLCLEQNNYPFGLVLIIYKNGKIVIKKEQESKLFFKKTSGNLNNPKYIKKISNDLESIMCAYLHPEARRDEVWITNCDEYYRKEFFEIRYKSKRMGRRAFDTKGRKIPGMYPIFAKIYEWQKTSKE